MWKRLSNSYTLPLLGACIRGSELFMVSEWMGNGNIKQYLKQYPHVNRHPLLLDIARGVAYLHSMNVVHGDLKGVNILVRDDGSACLVDFGLMSIALDPGTTDITTTSEGRTKGTWRWMSPELFEPSHFGLSRVQLTKESDCYAFGMVIYEILSGKSPFEELKQSWLVPGAVISGSRPSIPEQAPSGATELWNLAQECWCQHPRDRPSSPTILDRLDNFVRMEDVTPFASRNPRPMQVSRKPTDTTIEWQPLLTEDLPKAPPQIDSAPQPSSYTATTSLQPQFEVNEVSVGSSGAGAGKRFKRAVHAVRAALRFTKFRFR